MCGNVSPVVPERISLEAVSACDLCGGSRFSLVLAAQDYTERTVEGEFTLARCDECGLHFLNPRPTAEDIGRVYPRDYVPHADTAKRRARPWQHKMGSKDPGRVSMLDRLSVWFSQHYTYQTTIPRWQGDGKILDVGCGNGAFLDVMADIGWKTHGVDFTPAAVAVASRKGHDVCRGDTVNLQHEDESIDVVYLSHVLEHTISPRQTLREIARVLKPGGRLYCAVPNWGGLQARVWGRYWSGLDLPRHLYQFDAGTLKRYLVETGFVLEGMITRSGGVSYAKSLRLFANGILGASFRREPAWLVAPFEVLALASGLFRHTPWGRDLRVIARK